MSLCVRNGQVDGCVHLRELSGGWLCLCERYSQIEGCVHLKETVSCMVVFMLKKQSNGWMCSSVRNGERMVAFM